MKRGLMVALAAAMLLGLTGCGNRQAAELVDNMRAAMAANGPFSFKLRAETDGCALDIVYGPSADPQRGLTVLEGQVLVQDLFDEQVQASMKLSSFVELERYFSSPYLDSRATVSRNVETPGAAYVRDGMLYVRYGESQRLRYNLDSFSLLNQLTAFGLPAEVLSELRVRVPNAGDPFAPERTTISFQVKDGSALANQLGAAMSALFEQHGEAVSGIACTLTLNEKNLPHTVKLVFACTGAEETGSHTVKLSNFWWNDNELKMDFPTDLDGYRAA